MERPCTGVSEALAVAGQAAARTPTTSAIRSEETAVLALLGSSSDKCSPGDDACVRGTQARPGP
jgi:hypothetical protein